MVLAFFSLFLYFLTLKSKPILYLLEKGNDANFHFEKNPTEELRRKKGLNKNCVPAIYFILFKSFPRGCEQNKEYITSLLHQMSNFNPL